MRRLRPIVTDCWLGDLNSCRICQHVAVCKNLAISNMSLQFTGAILNPNADWSIVVYKSMDTYPVLFRAPRARETRQHMRNFYFTYSYQTSIMPRMYLQCLLVLASFGSGKSIVSRDGWMFTAPLLRLWNHVKSWCRCMLIVYSDVTGVLLVLVRRYWEGQWQGLQLGGSRHGWHGSVDQQRWRQVPCLHKDSLFWQR